MTATMTIPRRFYKSSPKMKYDDRSKLYAYMKNIQNYISLVFKKLISFWGALGALSSIGLFFFGNGILPQTFPAFYLGSMLLLLTLMACGYSVWRDQQAMNESQQKRISELKGKIPEFKLSGVKVFRYSITPIIKKYENELKTIDTSRKSEAVTMEGATKNLQQMLASTFRTAGIHQETIVEKYNRIKKYLEDLRSYEGELKHTYQVIFEYSSSLSATNIEMTLSAEKSARIILEDRYPYSYIPTTAPPDYQKTTTLINSQYVLPLASIDTSSSSMKNGVVHSGVDKHINVGSVEEMFDNELYVQTSKESVKVKVQFKSSELRNVQIVEKVVNLGRPSIIEIKDEYDTGL